MTDFEIVQGGNFFVPEKVTITKFIINGIPSTIKVNFEERELPTIIYAGDVLHIPEGKISWNLNFHF